MAFNRKKYSLPSPGSQHFDAKVKEILEIREGVRSGQSPAFITYGDLSSIDLTPYLKNISQDQGPLIVTGGNPPQPPTNLVVAGGMLGNRLSWTPSVSSDVWYYQVWMSNTQNRGDGGVLSTVPDPQSVYVHHLNATEVLLDHYYWVRAVSWSGLYSTWEPSDAQGGYLVTGATSYAEMVDEILEKLQNQITESQLYEDLQDRIDLIDTPVIGLVDIFEELDERTEHYKGLLDERITSTREEAEIAREKAADALLSGLVDASNALERLRAEEVTFGTYRDAISYIDPETAQIKLYAVDSLASEVGGQLSEVGVELDGVQATLDLKASQTSLDENESRITGAEIRLDGAEGSIISATEDISLIDGRLETAETSIVQHDGAILLRATKTELDEAVSAILEGFTPAVSYQFNGTLEGWEASADLTAQTSTVVLDGSEMYRESLTIDGEENTIISFRIKRLTGSAWTGKVQYKTSGHGFSDDHYKTITEPSDLANWSTVQVSMRELTAGGDDWITSTITGIKLIFGTGEWEIAFIEVGKSSIEQFLFADFDTRMTQAEIDIDANTASIILKADQVEVDELGVEIGAVEIRMDAAESAIDLKAAQTQVTLIGEDLDAVETRMGSAELRLDGAEANILLKAEASVVSTHETRIDSAELRLDGAEADILLRATSIELGAVEGQVNDIQVELDAQEGIFSIGVTSLNQQVEINAETIIESLLEHDIGQDKTRLNKGNLAVADFQIQALASDLDAEASARLLLATRVDGNEAGILQEAIARSDADGALATQIDLLDTRVDDNYAVVQTQAESIDGIQGKYTVKIDNNGVVSGYGLISEANDGEVVSQFGVVADSFFVGYPGKGNVIPFIIGDVDGTPTVGINGQLVVDGSIFAHSIGADQINAFHIAANEIDGTHISAASDIIIGNTEDGDYCRIHDGDIEFWRYISGGHILYKNLRKFEYGTDENNATVIVPGPWDEEPEIIVTPQSIKCYDHNYPNQSQTLEVGHQKLGLTAQKDFQFIPSIRLTLGSASNLLTHNETVTGWETVLSTNRTSPENTSQIEVTGGFSILWNKTTKCTNNEGEVSTYNFQGSGTISLYAYINGENHLMKSINFSESASWSGSRIINLPPGSHSYRLRLVLTDGYIGSHTGSCWGGESTTENQDMSLTHTSTEFDMVAVADVLAEGTVNWWAIGE